MGLIIFIIASGLTLVFGLMDVLNFGHGVFIALGAFVATSVMGGMADWSAVGIAVAQPGGGVRRDAGGDGGGRRARPGLRARDRAPGLRPAPEADPHHHGRHDRRRGADQGHLGPAADRAAAARGAARQLRHRRRGDREVPRAGGGHRPGGVRAAAVRAEPHQGRPADPRRRAGPRDGGVARLPHPPPVRRRVRRRLGAGRPGRRDVGPVPAVGDAADRRAGQRADLHRHHHRRPGHRRSAASSARCWSG